MSITPGVSRGPMATTNSYSPNGATQSRFCYAPLGLKSWGRLSPPAYAGGYRHFVLSGRLRPCGTTQLNVVYPVAPAEFTTPKLSGDAGADSIDRFERRLLLLMEPILEDVGVFVHFLIKILEYQGRPKAKSSEKDQRLKSWWRPDSSSLTNTEAVMCMALTRTKPSRTALF